MDPRILLLVTALILLVGCSPSRAPVPESPTPPPGAVSDDSALPGTGVSGTHPPSAPSSPSLPSRPLWPEPGAQFVSEAGHAKARTYSPFSFKGQTIKPVQTPEHTLLTFVEGDEVYLAGTYSLNTGAVLLAEPKLLFRLPHSVGQEWTIAGGGKKTYTYRITDIIEVDTPLGKLPAVVLSVSLMSGAPVSTQTWAPGYGVVRMSGPGGSTFTAAQLSQEEPPRFPAIGYLEPNVPALLVGVGPEHLVVGSDGTELGRVEIHGIRERVSWQRVGEMDFLWHESILSVTDIIWSAYTFHEGRFRRVKWVSPDRDLFSLPVKADGRDGKLNVEFQPDGTILYRGAYDRSGKVYIYHWDSTTLAFRGELQN